MTGFLPRFTLTALACVFFSGFVAPFSARGETALSYTVRIVVKTEGKIPLVRAITYTMTADALRIDASGKGEDKSYIWNLAGKTVASLDNQTHTYHADSLGKIMGFVDFSQLLGQYSGNNPKDSVTRSGTIETVAGIPCRITTRIHHFKGRVVGMINGDQTITQCFAKTFPGSDLYFRFQKALAHLSEGSPKGPMPEIAPLSLRTIRTTDYKPGFLVKLLSTLRLYDISRVPGRQIEKETVQSLSTREIADSLFAIPPTYAKESAPKTP